MLNIIDRKIFTNEGEYLKSINCPKNVSIKDLTIEKNKSFYCKNCEKSILDTDYISEDKLIDKLKKDKNICLKISRLNPMFRFVQ